MSVDRRENNPFANWIMRVRPRSSIRDGGDSGGGGSDDVTGVVIHGASAWRAESIRRAVARETGNCFRLLAGAAILVSELASGRTSRGVVLRTYFRRSCRRVSRARVSTSRASLDNVPVKSTSIRNVGTGGQRLQGETGGASGTL